MERPLSIMHIAHNEFRAFKYRITNHKQPFYSTQDIPRVISQPCHSIMVYPKHQTLPPSPHKKAKTASNTSSYSLATDEMNTTSPSSNLSCSSDSSTSSQVDTVSIIFEMMKNYNTMIEMQQTSIKNIEEGYAKSTAMFMNKFDVLLNHVKALEERLEDIEGKATTNTKHISDLGQAVGGSTDTLSDILESRLRSLSKRVSSIEHLIILNGQRKRVRSSQGEDTLVN